MKQITDEDCVAVLNRVATISKMDCWFYVDEDGYVYDLENDSERIDTEKAVHTLVDGMTYYDFGQLSEQEKFYLLNIVNKL